jgi:hypothetical protein
VTISTKDGLVAAKVAAQDLQIYRSGARTTVANGWFTTFDLAGTPGAGTLAGTSTAAGVKPDDSTAGTPTVNAFSGSNAGAITALEFSNTVTCRMCLADMLWKAGAYAFNASAVAVTSPDYSSRAPSGGTDFTGCQLWAECVTAFTGNPTITVTYTNQAGTGGRTSTTAFGFAPTVGRMYPLNLQAGDTGVKSIQSVTATVATVGTFNLLVIRRLKSARIRVANDTVEFGPDKLMTQVFADSALFLMVNPDSTAIGVPEVEIEIANG